MCTPLQRASNNIKSIQVFNTVRWTMIRFSHVIHHVFGEWLKIILNTFLMTETTPKTCVVGCGRLFTGGVVDAHHAVHQLERENHLIKDGGAAGHHAGVTPLGHHGEAARVTVGEHGGDLRGRLRPQHDRAASCEQADALRTPTPPRFKG